VKIRYAHLWQVTKQAARTAIPVLTGLAALVMSFLSPHAAQAQTLPVNDAPAVPDRMVTQQSFQQLVAAVRQHSDAALPLYQVKSGDTMSAIAADKCDGHANDWTGIYAASRAAHLTGRNANEIDVGQQLAISCKFIPSQLKFAPAPPPPPPPPPPVRLSSAVRHTGTQRAYHRTASASTGYAGNVSASGYGSSYQRCVIRRESGGRSQVMNSSGHYGLYQFDYGTWVSGGGSGSTFGHASVSEQNRVFASVYAARGTAPWSPYDGC
jgi:hypothetical protein